MKAAVVFLVSLLVVTPVFAVLPPGWDKVGGYMGAQIQPGTTDSELLLLYLQGVGDGFVAANGAFEAQGKPLMYCQPRLSLRGENYKEILDAELKTDLKVAKEKPSIAGVAGLKEIPLSTALLFGLQHRFPCEKKAP